MLKNLGAQFEKVNTSKLVKVKCYLLVFQTAERCFSEAQYPF